jgi:hypothetical protein
MRRLCDASRLSFPVDNEALSTLNRFANYLWTLSDSLLVGFFQQPKIFNRRFCRLSCGIRRLLRRFSNFCGFR